MCVCVRVGPPGLCGGWRGASRGGRMMEERSAQHPTQQDVAAKKISIALTEDRTGPNKISKTALTEDRTRDLSMARSFITSAALYH